MFLLWIPEWQPRKHEPEQYQTDGKSLESPTKVCQENLGKNIPSCKNSISTKSCHGIYSRKKVGSYEGSDLFELLQLLLGGGGRREVLKKPPRTGLGNL